MDPALLRQLRHELRTPINHIVGFTELWLEEAADLRLPEIEADLEHIHDAGRQMLALVMDGLSAERAGADAIDIAGLGQELRTPLNAVVGYSELLREEAAGQAPERMLGDLDTIRGAAIHLLSLLSDHVLERPSAAPSPAPKLARPLPLDAPKTERSTVLVVDDNSANRELLARRLERLGHTIVCAENGRVALEQLAARDIDLVLLDIMMPEMDGYQVLEYRYTDARLRDIPFIMLSAIDELDSVVRCIELGADDYLPKPFPPVLLRARVEACLERKRLHDLEREHARLLALEQERSEQLLLNILPQTVAERLKAGEQLIADRLSEVTALFSDLVGFTEFTQSVPPADMVRMLNHIYSAFDALVEEFGVEKIKTLGDGYVVLAGAPSPRADHAEAIADLSLEMRRVINNLRVETGWPLNIRIGIDSGGPVVAGVVGIKKFAYDVWGDTMNTASRMESHGVAGQIQVTEGAYERLRHAYDLEARGFISVKSKGDMRTYFLIGKQGERHG